jgi:hypothetical protein
MQISTVVPVLCFIQGKIFTELVEKLQLTLGLL